MILLASSWLTYLILAELMPGAARLGRAAALMAFTPVFLYLAFKTLPETPAFFFSALAALALLRSLRRTGGAVARGFGRRACGSCFL